MIWPFKKNPLKYYRICKKHGKYTIQRKLPSDHFWRELYYYPSLDQYGWYVITESFDKNTWTSLSLELAREKAQEFVDQYFSAEAHCNLGEFK